MIDAFPTMPLKWHCIRCKREFPNLPTEPGPYARQTQTDANGWRTIVGDICKECTERDAP